MGTERIAAMNKVAVLNLVGLSNRLVSPETTPFLHQWMGERHRSHIAPVLPAVARLDALRPRQQETVRATCHAQVSCGRIRNRSCHIGRLDGQ